MNSRINNSSDFDLDLFFSIGMLWGHFATAGLQVRDEIFFDPSHNNFRMFIKNYPLKKAFEYKLNPYLDDIISSKYFTNPEFKLDIYLKDFIDYAKMGLFSFDRTTINSQTDPKFHLVAYPIIDEQFLMLLREFYPDRNQPSLRVIEDNVQYILENFQKSSFDCSFLSFT